MTTDILKKNTILVPYRGTLGLANLAERTEEDSHTAISEWWELNECSSNKGQIYRSAGLMFYI